MSGDPMHRRGRWSPPPTPVPVQRPRAFLREFRLPLRKRVAWRLKRFAVRVSFAVGLTVVCVVGSVLALAFAAVVAVAWIVGKALTIAERIATAMLNRTLEMPIVVIAVAFLVAGYCLGMWRATWIVESGVSP